MLKFRSNQVIRNVALLFSLLCFPRLGRNGRGGTHLIVPAIRWTGGTTVPKVLRYLCPQRIIAARYADFFHSFDLLNEARLKTTLSSINFSRRQHLLSAVHFSRPKHDCSIASFIISSR